MPPKKEVQAEADDQTLPSKEAALFRQVVKAYESKQYKKALKTADGILKRFPNHGETLSMKGLTLSCMNRKEEAYELVKLGLVKSKCKSHVCWHVFGLLYRADKNYDESIKCYRNALRIDPDNLQILRDLSMLQVQRMDTAGLVSTRHKLLELKPQQVQNWMGFAVAHHLNQNYQNALQVLDVYENTMGKPETPYEVSELTLYRNQILIESGDLEGALAHLKKEHASILDRNASLEAQATCFIGLNRPKEANAIYLELIQSNPENPRYILSFAKTGGFPDLQGWTDVLPADQLARLVALLEGLEEKVPRSHLVRRVILDVADGDRFKQRLVAFLKPYLRKTIPALFSATKSLYTRPAKVPLIEEVMLGFQRQLQATNRFAGDEDGPEELPSTYLWVLVLLGTHYYRKGEFQRALDHLDEALRHTPTIEMLHVIRGRIVKHLNDPVKAWESVEKGRLLDVADRYLNTKSTKYLLRANRIRDAEKTISLFAAPQDAEPGQHNVVEMQCMWFELEEGDAYLRLGDVVTALKRWLLVDKHFQDMEEDQFDFHAYCLRKLTLRTYMDLLRFEKRSRGHKYFQAASRRIVKGYVDLFDMQQAGEDPHAKVVHLPPVSAASPAAAPEATATATATAAAAATTDGAPAATSEAAPPAKEKKEKEKKGGDDDEDEEEANKKEEFNMKVDFAKPLDAALPFAKAILEYGKTDVAGTLAAAQLFVRRQKPLLVLQCLHRVAAVLRAPVSGYPTPELEAERQAQRQQARELRERLAALVGALDAADPVRAAAQANPVGDF